MKFNILKQRKIVAVIIIGVILTFIGGCDKGIDNPEPQKDYLEYGNIVKEGLIAYYPFDGNANDYSGHDLNGVENETSASAGRFGQQGGALKFDGVNDYIEIPGFSYITSDSGTICFWLKTSGNYDENKLAAVISKIDTEGLGYVLSVVHGSTDFHFEYYIPNLRGNENIGSASIVVGKYVFVAVTFSTNKLTYYFQGSPTEETTFTTGQIRFNQNDQPLLIGKSLLSKYGFFEGDIDDLLIYDRPLSKNEIMKLYNWK